MVHSSTIVHKYGIYMESDLLNKVTLRVTYNIGIGHS